MAENKTQKTTASVAAFLAALPDAQQRNDAQALAAMMRATTGEAPAMWGSAIVGYGDMRYQGASRGGDWFPVGFSPRKSALTVYLMGGVRANPDLLAKLGPHKVGGGCLYLTKFGEAKREDIDKLLLDKLSDALSDEQKENFVTNLLQEMRKDGTIRAEGTKRWATWRLT